MSNDDRDPRDAASPGRPRAVLLGASNLTLGLSTVVDLARSRLGSPLRILGAVGHGRSYGTPSTVLGRTLPGILQCGLWEAFGEAHRGPSFALVTDIGNDIVYGEPVPRIAGWVEACLDRLAAAGARIVMTRLPMANIRGLTRSKFFVARSLLFPGCSLSLDQVEERAADLEGRLEALGRDRELELVDHRPEWYGIDPIHVKRGWRREAWSAILTAWGSDGVRGRRSGLRQWLHLHRLAPERKWVLGLERRRRQPCGRLSDGTTLALY